MRSSATSMGGFSALELLVSVLLLSFLLVGLYTVLFQAQTVFDAQFTDMELRQEARVTISRISTELRMVGYGIENLPEGLMTAAPDRIVFAADIDDASPNLPCGAAIEAAANGGAERLDYRVVNGELLRRIDCWDGASWIPEYVDQVVVHDLLPGITVFRYFDGAGAELLPGGGALSAADRQRVRSVGVRLALRDGASDTPYQPVPEFQIETEVRLRNR